MNVLFWNFRCKQATELPHALSSLACLAGTEKIDLLVLADTATGEPKRPLDPGRVLEALATSGNNFKKAADPLNSDHPRVQVYTRSPGVELPPFRADGSLDIRRCRWQDREEILLCIVHFFDRRNYDIQDQAELAAAASTTIHDAEIRAGHARTVVFGDFNMNPYDRGMTSSIGFGAMMTRGLADRHTRPNGVPELGAKRFYNPSWARLGRELPEPPGTYYWGNISKPANVFWHHLDQVLIRPTLFSSFRDETFQIVTSLPGPDGGETALVRATRKHWKLKYSDHLPITFSLDLAQLGPATPGGYDA